jgi:hypothetical protein
MRVLALALLLFLAPGSAHAQARSTPPTDGLYEDWFASTMEPVGPLAAPPRLLPRWLDVRSRGRETVVTFQPEGRLVWRIVWGPEGPAQKTVEVDGEVFSTSRFEYDAQRRLTRKVVDGPGIGEEPVIFDYTTDAAGRILTRTRPAPALEVQRFVRSRRGVEIRTELEGVTVRVDVHDAEGRRLETRWSSLRARPRTLSLRYVRDRRGNLTRLVRNLDGRRAEADAGARDPHLSRGHVAALSTMPIERDEVLLLLGAPETASDDARGPARRRTDDFSPGCWLNEPSTLEYDATGLLVGSHAACICGFCVDADLPVEAPGEDVLGVDLHYTRGPWVRLDGAIDVTVEHRVLTPRGPVPAGELRAGDEVLGSDGAARVLRSAVPLGAGEERLGRNVRTSRGRFAAGGLLFESESARACDDEESSTAGPPLAPAAPRRPPGHISR